MFREIRSNFSFLFHFDEIPVSKQDSFRWDAAFFGDTSGAILVAYMSHIKRTTAIYGLSTCT